MFLAYTFLFLFSFFFFKISGFFFYGVWFALGLGSDSVWGGMGWNGNGGRRGDEYNLSSSLYCCALRLLGHVSVTLVFFAPFASTVFDGYLLVTFFFCPGSLVAGVFRFLFSFLPFLPIC